MPTDDRPDSEPGWRVHDLLSNDPDGRYMDHTSLSETDLAEIDDIMASLVALRQAEEQLSAASQRYMRLNATDMKAIHYLIAAGHRGEIATAATLRAHLGLSSGATTKLLDRLETSGHLQRRPHPDDRRSVTFTVTNTTREIAIETIGRQQFGRVLAALSLTSAERITVRRFLDEMTSALSTDGSTWARPGREN